MLMLFDITSQLLFAADAWVSFSVMAAVLFIVTTINGYFVAIALHGRALSNPVWIRVNANGTFQLQLKSAAGLGETFVLSAAVGTVVEQKTITQAAQQ